MEAEVYKPVVDRLPDCKWIVDLGANIGLASRYLLERYPAARLVAVEPNPSSYAVLERNLSAVAADRATAVRGAIWDRTGPVAISDPGAQLRYDCVRVREVEGPADGAVDVVQGYTLPELCARHRIPFIDLLKVDVEGAEVALFAGDTDWLRSVKAIAVEFHGVSRAACRFDELMDRYGFVVDGSYRHTVIATRL
jgi:FkbM family methyltransferase